ncbi:hypothetical protein [Agromyces bauzanensis]|uniref:Uncharacterized protein n=1 Tax=Agromyces bauzanensis TaxID=1308924 RepID=A0A917PCL1_9MICO|nr:hypothetical protein [Agromyces bauzanensis]GGJ70963.1 hypothetical protein GCM10011372_06090 [Agromyces bauzanensis]
MRWDLLFDDLESQLDQEQRDEERALALEEERLRLGRLTLRDRLAAMARAAADEPAATVRVELRGGRALELRPRSFGRDWVSATLRGAAHDQRQCIVPLAAVTAVIPTAMQLETSLEPATEPSSRLAERIGLTFVLRDLCRRRAPVHVTTDDGRVHGTLDRVARDHVDLALHDSGVPRREREVRGYRIIPIDRLLVVEFG